jgi:hypothetical protein
MAQVRTLARSFAGGEVTPEFWGRIDDGKYQTGFALARNFIPLPHGPVANRAGTSFVRATKDSSKRSVMRAFSYSHPDDGSGVRRRLRALPHPGRVPAPGRACAYNGATAYTPGDMVSSAGWTTSTSPRARASPRPTPPVVRPAGHGRIRNPQPLRGGRHGALHIEQSLDVLTVVHTGYPPRELRRGGATKWFFTRSAS